MTDIEYELLPYKIGGLLYTPAVNEKSADKILNCAYKNMTSVAFCLEDAVMDGALKQAEKALVGTFKRLYDERGEQSSLPLLFIRIRTPEHMERVHSLLGKYADILTGYILPKFDLSNGEKYAEMIGKINDRGGRRIFIMPILESAMIADKSRRTEVLLKIRELLVREKKYVLNVRVGGNDFCNLYGLRRSVNQTVYDVGVVRDILTDIVNMFAADFVISGPVWEYFGENADEPWANGLRRELELDRVNGFIGKTAVHPCQLPIIFESLKADRNDYEDALKILGWSSESFGVEKSSGGGRMNEVKCHTKWAKRVKILGDIYGIR